MANASILMQQEYSDPLVSIITVVRNGMPFIAKTIESVLSQTYPEIEYIVIDGGSTDGTLDCIRRHEAAIGQWISEPDQGIADAFNKGLRRSSGAYRMFLNADDWLADPDAVARLISAARDRNWPQVIYGDCDLYDRDGGRVLSRTCIRYSRSEFLRGVTLPHPGLLTHSDYFTRYGEFDTSFRIAMDFEFFVRGVPDSGAHRASVLVTNVRTGGASTRDRGLVIEEIVRALRKNGRLSKLAEIRLRAYYSARRAARVAPVLFGLSRNRV